MRYRIFYEITYRIKDTQTFWRNYLGHFYINVNFVDTALNFMPLSVNDRGLIDIKDYFVNLCKLSLL